MMMMVMMFHNDSLFIGCKIGNNFTRQNSSLLMKIGGFTHK